MSCRIGVALAVLFLGSTAALADDERTVERSVDLTSGGRLRIETYKGSIRLSAWDQDKVQVVARVEPGDDVDPDYAEDSVEATRVEIRGDGDSVRIESDYSEVPCKRSWALLSFGCSKTLPYVHYEIRAPRRLTLRIKDHKSDIRMTGLEGDLNVDTYKGDVEGDDLSGELDIETYKGTVHLKDVSGRLKIETYKGDVSADVKELTGRSSAETYKGKLALSFSDAQGLSLLAHLGRRADFHSDFDLGRERQGRRSLEGEINGGGPRLSIESHKGDIRIYRR